MNNNQYAWDDNPPPGPPDEEFFDWYSDPNCPVRGDSEWQGTRGNTWSPHGRIPRYWVENDMRMRGYSGLWRIDGTDMNPSEVVRRRGDYVPGQSIADHAGVYAYRQPHPSDPMDMYGYQACPGPRALEPGEFGGGYDTAEMWHFNRYHILNTMGIDPRQREPSRVYEGPR